jgi:hypothetical protein
MVPASFAAYYGPQPFLPERVASSITDPGVFRAVAGVGVYLMLDPGRLDHAEHRGRNLGARRPAADALGPWTGAIVLTLWGIAVYAPAIALVRHRDA